MKFIILSIQLIAGNHVLIEYAAPFVGRVYVAAKCDGGTWQNGYVNSLTSAGTNSITFRRPSCDAAMFKLTLQSE